MDISTPRSSEDDVEAVRRYSGKDRVREDKALVKRTGSAGSSGARLDRSGQVASRGEGLSRSGIRAGVVGRREVETGAGRAGEPRGRRTPGAG